LKGILPEYDFSIIKRSIIDGKYDFDESDGNAKIIIGKKLANKIGVELGDKVVILAIDPNNPYSLTPKIEQLKSLEFTKQEWLSMTIYSFMFGLSTHNICLILVIK
jgi:ABC-type lipoprotein release transport system permease subunit